MIDQFVKLKKYCSQILPFTADELSLIDKFFEAQVINKKSFLLDGEQKCQFIAFIEHGSIRHFHIKNGEEKTCDISFDNAWVTDFKSFNNGTPSTMNLQAMEDTKVNVIRKEKLLALYKSSAKFETFGRLMAEQVAQRATDIAMSLSADKPEERYLNLVRNQPNLFQRVPQKYIANFLGISPESLSRIRNRVVTKLKS